MPEKQQPTPVVGRAIKPVDLFKHIKEKQEAWNALTPEQQAEKIAETEETVKKLKAMGGFVVFQVPVAGEKDKP
jgi:hypothetical protein